MTPLVVREVSAMVQRVDAALRGMPPCYTDRIRRFEADLDLAARALERGTVEPTTVKTAITQLEVAWLTEIAKQRRLAAAESQFSLEHVPARREGARR